MRDLKDDALFHLRKAIENLKLYSGSSKSEERKVYLTQIEAHLANALAYLEKMTPADCADIERAYRAKSLIMEAMHLISLMRWDEVMADGQTEKDEG